ncbi:Mrp/NBP35 family ATP-binding protein [Parachlamydia sp. AcF125]|uniref:Mrp/NBP35 family ATP-binding protein n=1 Tax=Parachlamydia sp. AcF125 TaxID=2795736 RepID=UPI001BC92A78|nr:Mrp/NBP35 family ATP-binding protein [Parachlamydia sp. AcF125]MBS4167913.1 Iron-sulfur cluster carrier protein [Parachlamydia sp. AcF125]
MPIPMFDNVPMPSSPSIQHVIAIAAGKGGVGKSTLAVNLALALKKLGYKAGILDADIYGPSIRKMLPEDRLPTQQEREITPALCQGIQMISMAYFRPENEAAVVRAPIANQVISQFLQSVSWGQLDYLLIDFPPGTGDIQLTLSQQANLTGAVVITTPQEISLLDVRKAVHMFNQVKIPLIGIIENMSYYEDPYSQEKRFIFGEGGGKKLALEIGAPLLGSIPLHPEICRSGDEGSSLFSKTPLSSSAQAFQHAASQLVDHVEALKENTKKGLSHFELNWKEMAT